MVRIWKKSTSLYNLGISLEREKPRNVQLEKQVIRMRFNGELPNANVQHYAQTYLSR
jgi:hypothetical protein